MNGFRGREKREKKAKSKAPHVNPTCWAPTFVLGFIVRATRPAAGSAPFFRALVVEQQPSLLGRRSRRRHPISPAIRTAICFLMSSLLHEISQLKLNSSGAQPL